MRLQYVYRPGGFPFWSAGWNSIARSTKNDACNPCCIPWLMLSTRLTCFSRLVADAWHELGENASRVWTNERALCDLAQALGNQRACRKRVFDSSQSSNSDMHTLLFTATALRESDVNAWLRIICPGYLYGRRPLIHLYGLAHSRARMPAATTANDPPAPATSFVAPPEVDAAAAPTADLDAAEVAAAEGKSEGLLEVLTMLSPV